MICVFIILETEIRCRGSTVAELSKLTYAED